VEWAEKIPTFLPEKTQKISIEYQEDMDFRLVTFRN
jgi:tRNA A37 threonylcarbamoyladenosine biosynthesis protein TsaE